MRQYGQTLAHEFAMCNLFLNMCIVGLVQTGPSVYSLQTITDTGVIRSYTVYESTYCRSSDFFLLNRGGAPELSQV